MRSPVLVLRPRRPRIRRPRDHHTGTGDRPVRPDRRAVGHPRTAAPEGQEAGPPAEVDQTPAHRRNPLADPDRITLARPASPLSALADRLRPVPPLAARRHLAGHPDRVAGPR